MIKRLLLASLIFGSTLSLLGQHQRGKISVKDTITDRELMVPEEIERNFDQLLIDWKTGLKPFQVCESTESSIEYPDSTYINRLYRLPTEMELVYNPIVRSYIDMYTGRRRNSVEYFLGKSQYYFPIFEQALDEAGLPLELKYLPIIESALNPTIVSRAGATGLWQFMIGTGKMYNLEINSLVDERRDPLKATQAAVRYLKDLYGIYGDWNLVIAAYNCGPGNVNKAIRRSGGKTDYWEIYNYLPRETRGYVPAFIAATYVMNYYSLHSICPLEYDFHYATDTIVVDKYVHLQQIADVLSVDVEDVKSLNPQFKKNIIPGEFKKYTVTLPSTKATDFEVYKDSVYSYRVNEFLAHRKVVDPDGGSSSGTSRTRHKVKRGETLSSIASKHRVTVNQLKTWNRLKSSRLRIGQMLSVHKPVAKPKVTKPEPVSQQTELYAENTQAKNAVNPAVAEQNDNVQTNESSSGVLADYFNRQAAPASQATAKSQTLQEITEATIEVEPEIAAEASSMPEEARTIYHKVRIGETITQIATKYKVDKDDITEWNNLKKAIPKIGQRLMIHLPARSEETVEENADDLLADNDLTDTDITKSGPSALSGNTRSEISTSKTIKQQVEQLQTYTVKKGDTLGLIAQKFGGGLTARELMKANKLRSNKIKIGQKLTIPR